jgi:hypothetical protein
MEICRMDKSSHFYSGYSSQPTQNNPNYDFNENNNREYGASSSTSSYTQQQPHTSQYQEYQSLERENNWKSDNIVECKQENVNEMPKNEFSEPYQYGHSFNQITPPEYDSRSSSSTILSATSHALHTNAVQQQHLGPYQMTSTTTQLPSWYNPPNKYFVAPSHQPPQPNYFQHHQHSYHQGSSFITGQQSPLEPNMRNMIHLTNR